jgi:hypothetical protein
MQNEDNPTTASPTLLSPAASISTAIPVPIPVSLAGTDQSVGFEQCFQKSHIIRYRETAEKAHDRRARSTQVLVLQVNSGV